MGFAGGVALAGDHGADVAVFEVAGGADEALARLHDDLVLSLCLCRALDGVDWRPRVARGMGG